MYNEIRMNEKYTKLINACLPDELIKALEQKLGLDRKKVEYVCLEVVARVFGDGSDLSKETILTNLKAVLSGEEIKKILARLDEKFNISPDEASKVLEQLLPLLFKRITTLDDSYFIENKQEEIVNEDKEPTVEEVYKNIEKKAEAQVTTKEEPKHIKTKKALFKKKEKKVVKEETSEASIENKGISLVEKICMIIVGVSLLALIGVVVFLFIKQSI